MTIPATSAMLALRTFVLPVLLVAAATPAAAQNTIKMPGRTVEVVGLKLEMVLAYLSAEHQWLRTSAHQLLVAISGQDFGEDVAQWRSWMAAL